MMVLGLVLFWPQFQGFMHVNAATLQQLAGLANLLIVGLIFVEAWPFLRHPRLHLRKRDLMYERRPIYFKLPFPDQELTDHPLIYVKAEVVNYSSFLPIMRAEDTRAQVVFWGRKSFKGFYTLEDRVWDDGKTSTTVHTGLSSPRIVTLFAFDTLHHILIEGNEEGPIPGVVRDGEFEIVLILDAKDTMSKETYVGDYRFPDDFLNDTTSYDEWRLRIGEIGYAVFVERTKDGHLVASTMGKIPEKRLAALKTGELKGYEFRDITKPETARTPPQ
jgi:hypothetical protein